jgi:hypothetical protein
MNYRIAICAMLCGFANAGVAGGRSQDCAQLPGCSCKLQVDAWEGLMGSSTIDEVAFMVTAGTDGCCGEGSCPQATPCHFTWAYSIEAPAGTTVYTFQDYLEGGRSLGPEAGVLHQDLECGKQFSFQVAVPSAGALHGPEALSTPPLGELPVTDQVVVAELKVTCKSCVQ